MTTEMEVYCGTFKSEVFTIDLDSYDESCSTGATDDEISEAYKLLRDTMTDKNFANDGNRNHSAVNACIALHVMGYYAQAWLEAFCEEQRNTKRWFISDLDAFLEHVERVEPYLYGWGPEGNEGLALQYAID